MIMEKVVLLLGTNMGDRDENLSKAVRLLVIYHSILMQKIETGGGFSDSIACNHSFLSNIKEVDKSDQLNENMNLVTSKIYETAPWGFNSDDFFLNQAVEFDSTLTPENLLDLCQQIEVEMGREKHSAKFDDTGERLYFSRIIDIDIIFYGDRVVESDRLTIPHPLMCEREFVLKPLLDLIPDYRHPILELSVLELYKRLRERQ